MKSFMRVSLIVAVILGLNACGGGGSADGGADTSIQPRAMEKGKPYKIEAGDTIVRTEEPTVIKLETDIKSGNTTAVLISGGATIE